MILDLYAGAGGWDEGARQLGMDTIGLEIWHDACVTAVRAGHPRIQCDIATYPTAPFVGRVTGLIASPPCQAWSMAGNRKGEQDKERVHELVNAYAQGANNPGDGWADPRSHHAAQPIRWVRDLRPEWVCLEQVPPVIDLWHHMGDVLCGWGYAAWVGILNAADYGVPQTRKRAILIASRVRPAYQPETTHEQDPPADALFGARRRWVSMAEALGWTGTFHNRRDSPAWIAQHGERCNRESDEPAPTITGEAHRWHLRNGTQNNACTRPLDQPAGTLFFGQRCNDVSWVLRNGNQPNAAIRTAEEPAPTMAFGNNSARVEWVQQRPATTVCATDRIAPSGHRNREPGGESQFASSDTVRITVPEAAALQSFRPDYPWHGTKTSQFLQVGNAIPPGLAAAVIAKAAGIPASRLAGVS